MMNKTQLHEELQSMLKTLTEQHDHLSAHKDIIPQPEVDLFLQNVRKLYEFGLILHHRNAMYSLDDLEVKMMERLQTERKALDEKLQALRVEELKKAGAKKNEEIPVPQVTENISFATQNEKQVKSSTTHTEKNNSSSQKGDVNHQYDDKPTLGDSFNDSLSLADKMAMKYASLSVAEKMKYQPIADLKNAIGINEKFLFIQQLFRGNLQQYNEAIEKINLHSDSKNAFTFIQTSFAVIYGWNDNHDSVQAFYELVHRRFMK